MRYVKCTSEEIAGDSVVSSKVMQLVNSHRKVDLSKFLKEVKSATYLLQFEADELIGILRYYPMNMSYLKKQSIDKKYINYYAVSTVIISKKHRGKGYGKKLMKKLISYKLNLFLDTYLSWAPAIKLYLSTGFQIARSIPDKKANPIDWIIQFYHPA